MRRFIIILALFLSWPVMAQLNSGYFGSYHGVEFRAGGGVSFDRVVKLKETSDGLRYKARLQMANMNYRLNYTWLFGRKMELLAGYEFASMRTNNNHYVNNAGNGFGIEQPVSFNKHAADIQLRFYRKGSIAPIGKYLGFGFYYGRMSVPDSISVPVAVSQGELASESSFFVKSYGVGGRDTVNLKKNSTRKYVSHGITAHVGRNYALTDNLLLNLNMRVRVLSIYSDGQNIGLGAVEYSSASGQLNDSDGVLRSSPLLALMHDYNRTIQFEVGVKYFF